MATQLKPHRRAEKFSTRQHRRPAWRQRLVEAERGVTRGFRDDSTLFLHFFSGSVILVTAVVLNISPIEWTVLILSLTLVVAAEMFNKVLLAIGKHVDRHSTPPLLNDLRIGTAAVFVTIIGGLLTIGLIFGRHVWSCLAHEPAVDH